jgi:hypothetical protein
MRTTCGVSVVLGVPVGGKHQEIGPDQPLAAIRERLVDDDFGLRRIERDVLHQREVHVVEPHGAVVRAAHAPQASVRRRHEGHAAADLAALRSGVLACSLH